MSDIPSKTHGIAAVFGADAVHRVVEPPGFLRRGGVGEHAELLGTVRAETRDAHAEHPDGFPGGPVLPNEFRRCIPDKSGAAGKLLQPLLPIDDLQVWVLDLHLDHGGIELLAPQPGPHLIGDQRDPGHHFSRVCEIVVKGHVMADSLNEMLNRD